MAIFTGIVWIINSLVIPETYAPVLLRRRAAALSKKTGKVYVSKVDVGKPHTTIGAQFKVSLLRPWILLFKEPIVLLTSIYMAIIYGTLYLCFAAFPIVFQQGRGWSPGKGGLAFIGIAVGMVFAITYTLIDNRRYMRVAAASPGGYAPPEARLPPTLLGSILIPAGLFWFAWTNGTDIHWIVCIMGSAVFAMGLVLVFLSLMNYLVDSCKLISTSRRLIGLLLTSLRCHFRRFRSRSQLRSPISVRCRIPPLHDLHVRGPWQPLGQLHSRLLGCGLHPLPFPVLQVR